MVSHSVLFTTLQLYTESISEVRQLLDPVLAKLQQAFGVIPKSLIEVLKCLRTRYSQNNGIQIATAMILAIPSNSPHLKISFGV